MPISNSYPKGIPIEDPDLFVGTKAANNRTVNYTAQGIASYLNINSKVAIGGQMSFQFTVVPKISKTIAFDGGGGNNTAFSAINKLIVSAIDVSTANITIFLNYLNNSQVLLSEQNQPNFFGHYKITGYTQIGTSAFYELDLEFIGGNGTIIDKQYYDLISFVLNTEAPATVWGNITGVIEDQTDLVDYVSSQITTPTLQQVTDEGNTITTNFSVITIGNDSVSIADVFDPTSVSSISLGGFLANSANSQTHYLYDKIYYADETTNKILEINYPASIVGTNKTQTFQDADGTIALTSDITAPTLQEVTDEGNETDNNIISKDGNYKAILSPYGLLIENENPLDSNSLNYLGMVRQSDLGLQELIFENVTTAGSITIPNATGTLALTSDIPPSSVPPLTTKGDLYTYSTVDARLPIGLDTQVLLADSSTPTGLKWSTNTAATPLGYYGAFSDVTDQFATVINTGYPMLLGVTDLSNGITVVSGSRITIANTGIYNIQWSGQFRNPTANEHDVTIWLRKNGVDVPGSAGVVLVPKKHGSFDGHNLPSWNYLLDALAGDYYEFVWSTQNLAVFISFDAPIPPAPSTASVILTVTQQSGIMAGTGITAVNSLTSSTQTMVVGTGAANLNIVSSGSTHTFNLLSNIRRNANNSSNNNINYNGYAVTGSAESSAVWTITRLTISASGAITVGTATNVAWTNRESVIYI